ncbi:hypothetical protein lpymt_01636 [Legionella pneumophila]|nr:hypothetical protein lpymt_01636 [Legionella pneumophila]
MFNTLSFFMVYLLFIDCLDTIRIHHLIFSNLPSHTQNSIIAPIAVIRNYVRRTALQDEYAMSRLACGVVIYVLRLINIIVVFVVVILISVFLG